MSKSRPFKLASGPCRINLTEKGDSVGIQVQEIGHNTLKDVLTS